MLFRMFSVLYIYIITYRSMFTVPSMAASFVVPWFRAFSVRCSGIVWVILSMFQFSLLVLVLVLSSSAAAARYFERVM